MENAVLQATSVPDEVKLALTLPDTLKWMCQTRSHLSGCFCPWTFFQNIGFNMVPSEPFMSHLATQLGYSAGEFQALQLIVLAAFGVVDYNHLLPACWSTFWKSIFKQQLGCRFDIMDIVYLKFFFDVCNYICLDTSYHFLALSLLLKYSLFFHVLLY